jgi:glycerol-3-phosphate dehydrogenase (NAD(P)+)
MRAAVFGAGSWGTAFGAVLVEAGTPTTLWARRDGLAQAIREHRENVDYLPGVALPDDLHATHDAAQAAEGADLVVLAVPAQALRANLLDWAHLIPPDAVLVSLVKGVEVGTNKRMSEVIDEVTGAEPERTAVVSGPNLSHEIAAKQPAAAVVACADQSVAEMVQKSCSTSYFRVYTNDDVVGTELGGAVKNVIALAVGMAAGMQLGDNSRASLITRGLAETTRLGVALGAHPLTFAGLAGLGDLVATCSSPLSRNRRVGEQLGRGVPLATIESHMRMVAEGVKSSQSIYELAQRHGVRMPITEHVCAVIRGELSPQQILGSLVAREVGSERHDAD